MSKSTHFTGQPVYSQILNLLDKEKIRKISVQTARTRRKGVGKSPRTPVSVNERMNTLKTQMKVTRTHQFIFLSQRRRQQHCRFLDSAKEGI